MAKVMRRKKRLLRPIPVAASPLRYRARNDELVAKARQYLVGGVDSPVRSFSRVGMDPIIIKKGKGSKVYDHDGRQYIDYVLSWGAAILGHAHPVVTADIRKEINSGVSFGATTGVEIELAEAIHDAIPFIEKVRFVNSGTEAVMSAIRLARASASRDKILKFEGSYHGHADYLLAKAGSGLATLGIPSSRGVPKDFTKHTLTARFEDTKAITGIFNRYGRALAAVIVEPVGGNFGVRPPDPERLRMLGRLCRENGSLLIFDEVITGFRFRCGSFGQLAGVEPDIICLGKIIGGGLPVGAYGAKSGIMNRLAPSGPVYQASTFAGNPATMRAGLSTLGILKDSKDGYSRMENLARHLIVNIWKAAASKGVMLNIDSYGSMFSLKFARKGDFGAFYRAMIEKGVYLAPSEFEANFLSFAHTDNDIEHTIEAARSALGRVKR